MKYTYKNKTQKEFLKYENLIEDLTSQKKTNNQDL